MARTINYTKNGINYYRVTATVGRDSSGKPIRKEFYGKSKKDAEAKKLNYLNGLQNGLSIDHLNVTLGPLMKTWLFEVIRTSSKIKPTTFERYEGIYRNYIENSQLYSLKFDVLKSLQIQRYYNELWESGKSQNVIKNLNKLLKQFLNYAVNQGYLVKNPCISVTIPGDVGEDDDNEIDVFTDEEINLLKTGLECHKLKCAILLNLGTGLRLGELLGLKWSDLDMTNKELHVRRTLKRVNIIDSKGDKEWKLIEQVPKSKTSIRTIPIPSNLIPLLEEQDTINKLNKIKCGPCWTNSDFIFVTESGKNIEAQNLTRSYRRLLNKLEIPYRKYHSIRHTYSTKLFEAGVPLKTVQILLGHSDISTTANIYTHVMKKEKVKSVEVLNSLFA